VGVPGLGLHGTIHWGSEFRGVFHLQLFCLPTQEYVKQVVSCSFDYAIIVNWIACPKGL